MKFRDDAFQDAMSKVLQGLHDGRAVCRESEVGMAKASSSPLLFVSDIVSARLDVSLRLAHAAACAGFGVDPLRYELASSTSQRLLLHKTATQLDIRPSAVIQVTRIAAPMIEDHVDLSAPPRRRIVGKSSCTDTCNSRQLLRRGTPVPPPIATPTESVDASDSSE